ncbi:TRAP transporter substrate-binding protein [Acuticoccus mangrovi]|uniref:TRAP transporter substrate-binding protein n=1 Tax=Acuticoccus mangrovi TaxID=2796142 RepID=A0A934MF33_9HYPH|nr:TRAP transporter substrate-binding protein [Acuticoccus mangrovi]MBJ3774505.1 TRAP transporter substrate-binding protein [Acuticoccus mangrovi]
MFRLAAAAACALALGLAAAPAPTSAAERLTLTSQYGPGKPQTLLWERFAEILERERPGAYDINIVTNGALGGEKEEAEAIRLGAITGAESTIANLTTWVPLGAVLDLPFVFQDAAHIERVLEGPLGDELKAAYRAEGFETPAFIIFGARHLLGKTPLTEPGDVDGLTMRVLQSDLHVALWRSLGANPTALPITEAYTALSNGVVDAMDMTKSGFEALKLYEVAPVLTETAHIWAVGVVYFDANFWAGLDADERALFQKASEEAAAYFNEIAAEEQEAALQRAMALGASRAAVDQELWRAAVAPFVEDFVRNMEDPRAVDALEMIQEAR